MAGRPRRSAIPAALAKPAAKDWSLKNLIGTQHERFRTSQCDYTDLPKGQAPACMSVRANFEIGIKPHLLVPKPLASRLQAWRDA